MTDAIAQQEPIFKTDWPGRFQYLFANAVAQGHYNLFYVQIITKIYFFLQDDFEHIFGEFLNMVWTQSVFEFFEFRT
jgi:hypothetical protein